MNTNDDKTIRSGNETWRGAKDASDAAKAPPKEGPKESARSDTTTLDGEDVTKRDAKSVTPRKANG